MALLYFVVFGACFYAQSSLWESLFHEYFLDVRPRSRITRFRQRPWLRDIWFGAFSHGTLHHYLTFRGGYTCQFTSIVEKRALLERLSANLTPSELKAAVSAQFGNSLTWFSTRYFGFPVYMNLLWLLVAPGPPEAAAILLADLAFATPYLFLSKYAHPFLHETYESAIARAPVILRMLLRSRYGLAMRVSHFLHHRSPDRNFNLQIGADLPRGRWLRPTELDWADMLRIGLILPEHRQALQSRPVMWHSF